MRARERCMRLISALLWVRPAPLCRLLAVPIFALGGEKAKTNQKPRPGAPSTPPGVHWVPHMNPTMPGAGAVPVVDVAGPCVVIFGGPRPPSGWGTTDTAPRPTRFWPLRLTNATQIEQRGYLWSHAATAWSTVSGRMFSPTFGATLVPRPENDGNAEAGP
jgi:hypothetical protein